MRWESFDARHALLIEETAHLPMRSRENFLHCMNKIRHQYEFNEKTLLTMQCFYRAYPVVSQTHYR